MDAGTSLARQTRTKHRHELRVLTYVTLDQANGGIVRNLTREGIAVQAVAAVHPLQEVRIRFELRYPKLRVEARGQVMWSTVSGQCGIRFIDLPPTLSRDIQQWIFGDLLEFAALHSNRAMFASPGLRESCPIEEDGLLTSATPVKVIDLPPLPDQIDRTSLHDVVDEETPAALDWLLHPLSGSGLAWTVNALATAAGLLLFAVIFLSVTHETPSWSVLITLSLLVPALYWGFFQIFGGCSLGTRLARLTDCDDEQEPLGARFR
jgi:PilZ domain